ncbi:sugar phosphate isomerase/epimerase family protein [Acidisoma cladoniae]|uniref:sugar phosphate isomerase/epimerase family protein n=1 Tax=Acidisoma cladoniae TaxID=3040935 RepID=UPI002549EAA7|nr:sugar phosphate isomerase/epimerase [Acidisoma sp. PAMC 29798]
MSSNQITPSVRSHGLRGPLVMPFANLTHLSFPEMVEATRLAGFDGLSLRAHDALVILESGLTLADARSMAADAGIAIVRLDPLSAWTAMVSSDNTNLDITPLRFFQLCQALGCSYVSLNATFPTGHLPVEQVIEDFAKTCDLAGEFGVICDLENLPMWGVRTLNDAWDIVRQADRLNGGLVFDILHFVRGGSTLSDLEAIPGDRIHTVQLNDGPLALPAGVSLLENCFDRLWPGEGEFPITDVLRVLARIDGLAQVNPEVFSPANKDLRPSEVASISRRSLRDALARADIGI